MAEATKRQFTLVDIATRVMGSDDIFVEDYGQMRSAAVPGRPAATSRVEEVLAQFFGGAEAALVHGAGTGAIRAMLAAAVEPGSDVAVHDAPPYKTTVATARQMGLRLHAVDFDEPRSLRDQLRAQRPVALFVQHVPHAAGDRYDVADVVAAAREIGAAVLVDDNYAALRAPQIGVELGADASGFSLFKLLARANVGCIVGSEEIVATVRTDLSSAGCQVQGPDATDALRSLVYAPVALAIQHEVVLDATAAINRRIEAGALPHVRRAVATQTGMPCVVLVFERPVADAFLRAAWRNGSPSRSVGEEARFDLLPLFTTLASTFVRQTPELGDFAIRINPLRGGPETILRVLEAALADAGFRADAAAAQAPA